MFHVYHKKKNNINFRTSFESILKYQLKLQSCKITCNSSINTRKKYYAEKLIKIKETFRKSFF